MERKRKLTITGEKYHKHEERKREEKAESVKSIDPTNCEKGSEGELLTRC